jgi:tight adherence protein C
MESPMVYIVVLLAAGCAVFGMASLLAPDRRAQRLGSALRVAAPSVRRGGSRLERLVARWFKDPLGTQDPNELTALKKWLLQAGYDSPQAGQTYRGSRIFLAAALAMLAFLALPLVTGLSLGQIMGIAVTGGFTGYVLPTAWVGYRRKFRQAVMQRGLPDILDLLLVCTEAGLGLDMAIAKVAEETAATQPILAADLALIVTELRAGSPRIDAMRAFAIRTGIPETNSLVNLLIQSDTLGTSMAATLRVFAADIRAHQVLRAEEQAQTVTVKLSIVLVLCLMPALVISIAAPIGFHVAHTWQGVKMPTAISTKVKP